MFYFRIRLDKS